MNRTIIESLVKVGILPKNTLQRLDNRQCPMCGEDTSKAEFKDEVSLIEFTISGLCQDCQDCQDKV